MKRSIFLLTMALLMLMPIPAVAHPVDEADHHWQTTQATWYGPGFYGKGTACGHKYTAQLKGVAKLGGTKRDCGKLVRLRFQGRETVVQIIDTGARHRGRLWDLSRATCEELGRCYTAPIDYTY